MKVKLNITTDPDAVGDLYDCAEVEVTQDLRKRIFRFQKALAKLDADCLMAFGRPIWRFRVQDEW